MVEHQSDPSRPVNSSQDGAHPDLIPIVEKHRTHPFRRPIADHTKRAFEGADKIAQKSGNAPLLLDAGCGTGDSTRRLSQTYPDHLVLGVDKSSHRLTKEREVPPPENMTLIRADLMDFYRLAEKAGWQLAQHYILYPNPWPKPGHLMRRWHGSPIFPSLLALGGGLTLRTNWRPYAEEFSLALKVFGHKGTLKRHIPDSLYLTPFEEKYARSGQALWQVTVNLATQDGEG